MALNNPLTILSASLLGFGVHLYWHRHPGITDELATGWITLRVSWAFGSWEYDRAIGAPKK